MLAPLLPAETYRLLEKVLRTLQWLMGAIEAKDTTPGKVRSERRRPNGPG
jgi:hypothetical protein